MNVLKNSIVISVFLISLTCNSQEKIDNITFDFSSARRIPFHSVAIQIYKRADGNSAFAYLRSYPGNDDSEWKYSEIDTIYDISIEKFNNLEKKITLLERINLDKAYEEGADGNTCKIGYGAKGHNISYKFWVPKSETKKRGLDEFVALCEELLTLVKLDPKEILE